jgi:hypothetical protein
MHKSEAAISNSLATLRKQVFALINFNGPELGVPLNQDSMNLFFVLKTVILPRTPIMDLLPLPTSNSRLCRLTLLKQIFNLV